MTTTLPLFPHHRDYSATPTGIIPAAWLMSRPQVVELARELERLPKGGAIRHRRVVVEYTRLADGRWAYVFMTQRKQVKARYLVDVSKSTNYDTVNDDHKRFTDAIKDAFGFVAKVLFCMGVTRENSVPVKFNDEAPSELKPTHKAWREAKDLNTWMGWVA